MARYLHPENLVLLRWVIQGVSFERNKYLFLVNISRGSFFFFGKVQGGFRSRREINLEGIILRVENKKFEVNFFTLFTLDFLFVLKRFLNFSISYTLYSVRYYFLLRLSFPKKKKWTGRENKFPTSFPSFYSRGNESRMKRDHCIFPEARDWMSLNKRASWIPFRNHSGFPTIFKPYIVQYVFTRRNKIFYIILQEKKRT